MLRRHRQGQRIAERSVMVWVAVRDKRMRGWMHMVGTLMPVYTRGKMWWWSWISVDRNVG